MKRMRGSSPEKETRERTGKARTCKMKENRPIGSEELGSRAACIVKYLETLCSVVESVLLPISELPKFFLKMQTAGLNSELLNPSPSECTF